MYGLRPVDLLEETGWMSSRAWLAHGIHFNAEEIARLGKAGVGVCHCAASNMVLASGICPTCELEAAGSAVGLGVDGSASNDSSNMMEALRHALMIGRLRYGADRVTHRDVLRWATEGSARCLGRSDIGRIAAGYEADLALFKLDELRFSGAHDPLAALVLCGAHRADRVMIAGDVAGHRRRAGRARPCCADRRAPRSGTGFRVDIWVTRKTTAHLILFIAAIWAGAQNALAGGGSFITLPSLMLTGLDARAANITSTVALFPGAARDRLHRPRRREEPAGPDACAVARRHQPGRRRDWRGHPAGDAGRRIRAARAVAGPVRDCALRLGEFLSPVGWTRSQRRLPPGGGASSNSASPIYGGYFGGGIGFMMMAALTMTGVAVRNAGALKNILAGMMNASAVAIFVFSSDVHWLQVARPRGRRLVRRLGGRADAEAGQRETARSSCVVAIGVALTIGLFWRALTVGIAPDRQGAPLRFRRSEKTIGAELAERRCERALRGSDPDARTSPGVV